MQELLATRMEALETLRIQSKEEIDSLQKQLDAFRNE